jgi:hypothetical protein
MTALRKVFSANLTRLMQRAKDRDNDKAATATALERYYQVSDSAVSRYKKADVAANLDHLERLALAFGVQPWELLYPSFDPDNPPEVMTPERTKELQETLVAAAKLLGVLPEDEQRTNGPAGKGYGRAADRKVSSKSTPK